MSTREKIFIAGGLLIGAVVLRLLPHVPNFAPVGAVALALGLYLPRRIAIGTLIAALFVSDLFLGFYNGGVMVSVYASFLIITLANSLSKKKDAAALLGRSMSGAVLFFLVTNFAVWQFGTMYPHTFTGLMESYTMAIPFFKNTLASDMFYTFVIVGIVESYLYFSRRIHTWNLFAPSLQKEAK